MKKACSIIATIALLLCGLPVALPVAAADTVKVVTVGDSITCGIHFKPGTWTTVEFENKYAKLVVDKLNAKNDGKTYELTNLAISGSAVVGNDVIGTTGTNDTATSWYNQSKNKICHADILTIMLGTNDAGFNWENLRKPLYKNIYKQIVADFRAINPNLKLYIITSPYAVKAPYNANLINDIIPMQKELAKELDATLIDVFSWTKRKVEKDGEASFIDSEDMVNGCRVHPGEAGHAMMGDIVYAGIAEETLPTYITDLDKAPPEFTYALEDAKQAIITKYSGVGGDVVVPSEIDGYTIMGISNMAFVGNTAITSLTIPKTVKTIAALSFRGCTALTKVTLPDGLTSIGANAFYKCSALTAVNIPASVTSIGSGAFLNCSNVKLTVYTDYAKQYAVDNGISFVDKLPKVTKIAITTKPSKLTYIQGDSLSTKGMKLKLIYDNGTTKTIKSGWKASANLKKSGSKVKVTVKYDGKSTTYTVKVAALGTPKATVTNASKGIKISWKKIAGADKYVIYRRQGSGKWSKLKTTKALSYTDTKAKAGKNYTYRVRAVNGSYTGGYKTTASIRFLKAPGSVKLTKASKGFKVTWSKVAGAKKYELYRRTGSGKWAKMKTVSSCSYTDKTAKKGKYYTYRVRAIYGDTDGVFKAGKKTKR